MEPILRQLPAAMALLIVTMVLSFEVVFCEKLLSRPSTSPNAIACPEGYTSGPWKVEPWKTDLQSSSATLSTSGVADNIPSQAFDAALYCPHTLMASRAPGGMCRLAGATIFMAAQFYQLHVDLYTNHSRPIPGSMPKEQTPSQTPESEPALTSDPHLPWMLADYVLQLEQSQKQVSASKVLKGEAQLDLFLCSDPECTFAADMRVMSTENGSLLTSESTVLAIGFNFLGKSPVAIPVGTASEARGPLCARQVDPDKFVMSEAGYTFGLADDDGSQDIMFHEIAYHLAQGDRWVNHTDDFEPYGPVLMPVSLVERLWVPKGLGDEINHLIQLGDREGLSTMRYSVLKVKYLVTGWAGCATLILPDPTPVYSLEGRTRAGRIEDEWLYKHGWYAL